MNGIETRLGMGTVWKRFASPDGLTAFDRRIDRLRQAVERLNLEPESVHLAAEIAALAPDLDDADRVRLILLLLASMAAVREGSTCLCPSGEKGAEELRRLLYVLCDGEEGAESPERAAEGINAFLGSGKASRVIGRSAKEYKPFLYLDPFFYHQRMHFAEERLAQHLLDLSRQTPYELTGDVAAALEDVLAHPATQGGAPVVLSQEQRAAVLAAAQSSLTIISGGPGTGKTSIVVALLRLFARLGISVESMSLAAPTGKAAYRVGRSVQQGLAGVAHRTQEDENLLDRLPEPRTLHRLLGYLPGADRFRRGPGNPLDQSLIIVDESSMVDLALMDGLMAAVRPGARLVLLGDADQLPSVSAGAVFRDLLPEVWSGSMEVSGHLGAARVGLTRNYRMDESDPAGRSILAVAERINAKNEDLFGAAPDGTPLVRKRERLEDLEFKGVEQLDPGREGLATFLESWESKWALADRDLRDLVDRVYPGNAGGFGEEAREELDRLFETQGRSRILCLTRVFRTGTERINARIHALAAERLKRSADRFAFLPGEPVMMLRNDYNLGLFNGDQGIILEVRESDGPAAPMVVFPRADGYNAFHLDALGNSLELCHAMTVHKSQGSEFECVALILPEDDIPLLTREMLYTAVTRSRTSVVIVDPKGIFLHGIRRHVERFSGLSDRLRGEPDVGKGAPADAPSPSPGPSARAGCPPTRK